MLALRSCRGLIARGTFGAAELCAIELPGARLFAAAPNQMALIKQLREQTGAPIGDVKSALQAADWDLDKAGQELRKKGLAAASKKASRHAAEGLVGVAVGPSAAAIVEINSETDFVARNDQFKDLVTSAAAAVLDHVSSVPQGAPVGELNAETLAAARTATGAALPDAVAEVAGTVRENIRLRRAFAAALPSSSNGGTIGSYVHGAVAPCLGRIASLVLLEPISSNKTPSDDVKDLAHKLAMHVVAAAPRYLDRAAVPAAAVAAERALLAEQAAASGKPANIIEKMVEGRIGKFYEEVCLVDQPYVVDDKKKVGAVAAAAGLQIAGFVRVQVGEGLEAEEKDFAAEVAETVRSSST